LRLLVGRRPTEVAAIGIDVIPKHQSVPGFCRAKEDPFGFVRKNGKQDCFDAETETLMLLYAERRLSMAHPVSGERLQMSEERQILD
jgi:hypothetical protein